MIETRSAELIRFSDFVIPSSFVIRHSSFFQPLLEDSHPISKQDAFDVFVAKAALDQSPRQIPALGMFLQVRHEMGVREFILKRDLLRFRPLPVNELEKIEADGHSLDSNQIADLHDVVDVTVERRFFLAGADEHGIDPDHATARADGLDLLVGYVAFDVVIFSRVRVRDDHRLRRHLHDVVEPGGADVSKIDDDADALAFLDHLAAEWRESIARRTTGSEEPAIAGSISPNMGKTKRPKTELVESAQQIEIAA